MSGISPSYVLECVAESLFAEVRFNDLPIFRSEGKVTHSFSARVNAFALDGGNLLRALIKPWEPRALAPKFQVSIYRMMDKDEIVPVVQYRYVPALTRVADDGFTEVFRHTCTFADSFGAWRWESERPYDVAERGDVLEGVRQLHAALEQGDGSRFVDLNRTKLEELARSQRKDPVESVDAQRKWLSAMLELDRFRMEPLEPESLDVSGVCQGRLVQVKAPGGEPPLRGFLGGNKVQFDVMMMRDGERWIPAR